MEPTSDRKRVMIIDDSKEMRMLYADMFEGSLHRYEVEYEDDANRALGKVDRGSYDLIILDIIMEKLSVDSFLIRLRIGQGRGSLPVLIISVISARTLSVLDELSNVDFLQKPITREQLFEKIDQMLGGKS